MAKRRGFYEGMTDRRRLEDMDSAMIGNTTGYFANMPPNEIVKLYPSASYNGKEQLNDGIVGIDNQMRDDNKNKKTDRFPEKY